MDDQRRRNLRAALGFLRLQPIEPELRLLHRWLDTWTGVGLITVGVERHGMRLSLSHTADDEWRAMFVDDNPRLAPRAQGVLADPDLGPMHCMSFQVPAPAQTRRATSAR